MPDKKNPRKSDTEGEPVRAETIRDLLGEYLGRVEFGGESFVITRHGKPAAKLVPIKAA